ncbi:MAG: MFS transporter [Rhodospirillaceae bacterium]|nr:MFS transporter [Rhodospirillales bacterium]
MITLDRRRIAVFVAGASAFLDMYCTQALLPDLARQFHASATEVGLTVTMATLATALVAPLIGGLADMIGRKRVIVAGALLLVLPTLGIALADTLSTVLVLRFLQGLCIPAIFTVTVAYVGEEWPGHEMPAVIGLYTSGTVLGGMMGRLVSALAADMLGWREAFVVLGLINLAAGLALWAMLPPARNFVRSDSLTATLHAFAVHVRNPRLMATCGIGFTVLFALIASFTYGTFYLAQPPFSLSTSALGFIFVVYLMGVVSAPVAGALFARIGRVGGMTLAVGCSSAGLLLTLVTWLPAVIAGLALLATGIFISQTASMSTINATVTHSRSAAVGLYVTSYYLGGSVGAVVAGLVWQASGWPGCVALVITILLAGLGLAAKFWR